jgi:predicted RNA binding protein YcfA (HicA-like mRNA interferase family)
VGLKDLPLAGGDAQARAFERLGWERRHETRGRNPHIILVKEGMTATLSIPKHKGRDVKRPLLANLIHQAGITQDEYVAAFKKQKPPPPGRFD